MITKTNKYRVKVDTPFFELPKDSFFEYSPVYPWVADDYPEMFEAVYRLQDGSEKCIGDTVWRSKNYEVKSVMFSNIHVSQETPLFGTQVACEQWLEKNANNIKATILKQNRDSSFKNLKLWTSQLEEEVASPEKMSIANVIKISKMISNSIENIEKDAAKE